jgi:hypothetical protein
MMEAREYPSYTVIGVSGNIAIATLAHNEWVEFVNGQLNAENREWYSTPTMRQVHNFTGRGYFPRGITLGDESGALIVIDGTYANDERLLAHEYGHALGLGHTSYPTTMNPVSHMRLFDSEGLIPKFRQAFPELAQAVREKKPIQIPTALLTGAFLFFFLKG